MGRRLCILQSIILTTFCGRWQWRRHFVMQPEKPLKRPTITTYRQLTRASIATRPRKLHNWRTGYVEANRRRKEWAAHNLIRINSLFEKRFSLWSFYFPFLCAWPTTMKDGSSTSLPDRHWPYPPSPGLLSQYTAVYNQLCMYACKVLR